MKTAADFPHTWADFEFEAGVTQALLQEELTNCDLPPRIRAIYEEARSRLTTFRKLPQREIPLGYLQDHYSMCQIFVNHIEASRNATSQLAPDLLKGGTWSMLVHAQRIPKTDLTRELAKRLYDEAESPNFQDNQPISLGTRIQIHEILFALDFQQLQMLQRALKGEHLSTMPGRRLNAALSEVLNILPNYLFDSIRPNHFFLFPPLPDEVNGLS